MLSDLLNLTQSQFPEPQYETQSEPMPWQQYQDPGMSQAPPGLGDLIRMLPMMAQGAMQAPQQFALDRADDVGRMEDEYMRMASEPMPERRLAQEKPNALGIGLSLLGEFLNRGMSGDSFQPGQVLGGYMGGLQGREQREQAQIDERLKQEMARRQQMMAGQQIKIRGAERQASRADMFNRQMEQRQFQAGQANAQREFLREQNVMKTRTEAAEGIRNAKTVAQLELAVDMARSLGVELDEEVLDRARGYLADQENLARQRMQVTAQAEWRRLLDNEAKLDGMITQAELAPLLQQRSAFAQQFGIPEDVLQLPKAIETLQREKQEFWKADTDRKFKLLDDKTRATIADLKAKQEIARQRIATQNRLGDLRVSETARANDIKMLEYTNKGLAKMYDKAIRDVENKLRTKKALFDGMNKVGMKKDLAAYQEAAAAYEAARLELEALQRDRAKEIGNTLPDGTPKPDGPMPIVIEDFLNDMKNSGMGGLPIGGGIGR